MSTTNLRDILASLRWMKPQGAYPMSAHLYLNGKFICGFVRKWPAGRMATESDRRCVFCERKLASLNKRVAA